MSSSFPGRIPELLEKNKSFMENYKAPPPVSKIAAMQRESGQSIVVLTCCDPRVVPENFLGPGIGAAVIRNAGGRTTPDVINSLVVLRSIIGTQNVLVIHHTDCGAQLMTAAEIAAQAKERTPDAAVEIDESKYGCWTKAEYEDKIKEDVMALMNAKALAGVNIFGFSYDVATGEVKPVNI